MARLGRPQSPAMRAIQMAIDQHGDLTLRDIMHHARVLVGAHELRLNCREARTALSNGLRAARPVFEKVGFEKRPHARRYCVLYGLAEQDAPNLLDAQVDALAQAIGVVQAMQAFWGAK